MLPVPARSRSPASRHSRRCICCHLLRDEALFSLSTSVCCQICAVLDELRRELSTTDTDTTRARAAYRLLAAVLEFLQESAQWAE